MPASSNTLGLQASLHPSVAVRSGILGVGAFAIEDIPNSVEIATIKYDSIVSEPWAAGTIFGKRAREILGDTCPKELTGRTILYIAMIGERADIPTPQECKFGEYFRSIPQEYDDPTWWSNEEVSLLLSGTTLWYAARHRRTWLDRIYEKVLVPLTEQDPTLFPPSVFTHKAFQWAHSAFSSRGFSHSLSVPPSKRGELDQDASTVNIVDDDADTNPFSGPEGTGPIGCMLPVLDIFNHDSCSNIAWASSEEGVYFQVKDTRARLREFVGQVRKGNYPVLGYKVVSAKDQETEGIPRGLEQEICPQDKEIFISYGTKSNEELVLSFGFSIPNNAFDTYLVKMSRPHVDVSVEGLWNDNEHPINRAFLYLLSMHSSAQLKNGLCEQRNLSTLLLMAMEVPECHICTRNIPAEQPSDGNSTASSDSYNSSVLPLSILVTMRVQSLFVHEMVPLLTVVFDFCLETMQEMKMQVRTESGAMEEGNTALKLTAEELSTLHQMVRTSLYSIFSAPLSPHLEKRALARLAFSFHAALTGLCQNNTLASHLLRDEGRKMILKLLEADETAASQKDIQALIQELETQNLASYLGFEGNHTTTEYRYNMCKEYIKGRMTLMLQCLLELSHRSYCTVNRTLNLLSWQPPNASDSIVTNDPKTPEDIQEEERSYRKFLCSRLENVHCAMGYVLDSAMDTDGDSLLPFETPYYRLSNASPFFSFPLEYLICPQNISVKCPPLYKALQKLTLLPLPTQWKLDKVSKFLVRYIVQEKVEKSKEEEEEEDDSDPMIPVGLIHVACVLYYLRRWAESASKKRDKSRDQGSKKSSKPSEKAGDAPQEPTPGGNKRYRESDESSKEDEESISYLEYLGKWMQWCMVHFPLGFQQLIFKDFLTNDEKEAEDADPGPTDGTADAPFLSSHTFLHKSYAGLLFEYEEDRAQAEEAMRFYIEALCEAFLPMLEEADPGLFSQSKKARAAFEWAIYLALTLGTPMIPQLPHSPSASGATAASKDLPSSLTWGILPIFPLPKGTSYALDTPSESEDPEPSDFDASHIATPAQAFAKHQKALLQRLSTEMPLVVPDFQPSSVIASQCGSYEYEYFPRVEDRKDTPTHMNSYVLGDKVFFVPTNTIAQSTNELCFQNFLHIDTCVSYFMAPYSLPYSHLGNDIFQNSQKSSFAHIASILSGEPILSHYLRFQELSLPNSSQSSTHHTESNNVSELFTLPTLPHDHVLPLLFASLLIARDPSTVQIVQELKSRFPLCVDVLASFLKQNEGSVANARDVALNLIGMALQEDNVSTFVKLEVPASPSSISIPISAKRESNLNDIHRADAVSGTIVQQIMGVMTEAEEMEEEELESVNSEDLETGSGQREDMDVEHE